MNKYPSSDSSGFTIVELMISLAILSTILIMCTVIMTQIGSLYDKGVNEVNLQNTTRTISADITSALQFTSGTLGSCTSVSLSSGSGGNYVGCSTYATSPYYISYGTAPNKINVYAVCIGNIRYSYVLGMELGHDGFNPLYPGGITTAHVLWRDTLGSDGQQCIPLDLTQADPDTTNVPPGGASDGTGGYEMMGDHMRLTNFSVTQVTGSIYSVDIWTAFGDSDLITPTSISGQFDCKGGTATQFCGTSQINSTVMRRTE